MNAEHENKDWEEWRQLGAEPDVLPSSNYRTIASPRCSNRLSLPFRQIIMECIDLEIQLEPINSSLSRPREDFDLFTTDIRGNLEHLGAILHRNEYLCNNIQSDEEIAFNRNAIEHLRARVSLTLDHLNSPPASPIYNYDDWSNDGTPPSMIPPPDDRRP
ncbi:hypothetical protein OSTOST_00804 [Ostertagia ostertagi]